MDTGLLAQTVQTQRRVIDLGKCNIILSSSQQAWNACAMGDTEQDHCFKIAEAVVKILKDYDANVLLVPQLNGSEAETLVNVVLQSNQFVAQNAGLPSFHLDIHTDAGYAGSGASGFFMSEGGKSFILKVFQEVCNLTPWGDGKVSYRNLYVLRETVAIAGLIEISFHDQIEQAKWLHMSIDAIAQAIVKGIVKETGISKVEKPPHFAEEAFNALIADGRDIKEKRFDEPLTRGEYFVLEAQKIKKVWI